jgi:predicted Zn-dependent protease
MKLTVVLSFLLAAVVWAADGRTVLTPGWNMFSPQQDIEVGEQVSPDAERQLPMLDDSRVNDYLNGLGRRLASKAPSTRCCARSESSGRRLEEFLEVSA